MANSSPHRFGKNDSRCYWRSKIWGLVNPRGVEVTHYSVRIQWQGQRHYFALGTANKEGAAAKAAEVYRDLASLGLKATLAKHKMQAPQPPMIVSIGEWLAATERVLTRRPATFGDYARSLRLITSEILAASKGRKRFGRSGSRDYRNAIEESTVVGVVGQCGAGVADSTRLSGCGQSGAGTCGENLSQFDLTAGTVAILA